MSNNSVLAKMAVQISANNAEFSRALSKSRKDLTSFTDNVTKIAGALGLAFGVQQIASFALEVSKLSGEAKAVSAAFERLPESTKLMRDLKQATGGTVSELDLMKRAVQASNFDISLEALPRLLQFATLRAQQTGQSVDYLVDSIVTGIGRKSKLILDNLGISAVALNDALGGASTAMASVGDVADAVGKIAEENLKNMEGFSENASTKLQRLTGSWVNLKVAIGDAANSTGIMGTAVDTLTASMDLWSSKNLSFWEKIVAMGGGPGAAAAAILKSIRREQEKINQEAKKQAQIIREVDRAFVEFNGNIDAYGKAITTHIYRTELLAEFTKRLTQSEDDRVTTLAELREAEKELNDAFAQTDITDKAKLKTTSAQILAIRAQIKAIEDLLAVEKKKTVKPKELKLQYSPDLEAEGSLNPELRNDQARNEAIAFSEALLQVGTSAEFAGGAMINLEASSADVTDKMSKQWLDLSNVMSGAIIGLAEGLGAAIIGVENFGEVVIRAFTGFAKEFGSMLIASGVAALALETLISNPVTAIAAGAALVAIAGAASAALSNSHSKLTGNGSSAPGKAPSEFNVNIDGKIRGYDLGLVNERQGYRRSMMG